MLDVAKILTGPDRHRFNNVVFFDLDADRVRETQKRIPGAIGFVGDFVDTVLLDDPDDERVLIDRDIILDDQLLPPPTARDDSATRRVMLRRNQHLEFVRRFPFDVVNLDLEEYLFKPKEELPGRVIQALMKVFQWQRKEFIALPKKAPQKLDGFSLMFTTRIGPANLSDNYLQMLRRYIDDNLDRQPELREILKERTGIVDVTRLCEDRFEQFFKFAIPKALAQTLMMEDWYIDSEERLLIYEFARQPDGVEPYTMLHLVFEARRHVPPKELRGPGFVSKAAEAAYQGVVRQIFDGCEILLTEDTIDKPRVQKSLDEIIARRKKYYPDQDQHAPTIEA
jgi:hypothetical protein